MKRVFCAIVIASIASAAWAQQPQYLGKQNGNRYDPNSTSNPYGQYGSKYSANSVNNPYGKYGSRYSNQSANNPYATQAPKAYVNGQYQGRATANPYADPYKPASRYEEADLYSDEGLELDDSSYVEDDE